MRRITLLAAALLGFSALSPAALAQEIDQSRGHDSRVDYESLTRFGPWDDRNYQLTQDDLALLAPNESELIVSVPAFYRVELRRTMTLLQTGPSQYPRSALPRFLNRYAGYLVDGKFYRQATHEDGRWQVVQSGGLERSQVLTKALEGEVRVTSPNAAAESAVAINPIDTNIVIAGSNGPGGGQRMHFSSDGGETWTQSAPLPLGGTCCDPTVAWSSDGSKAYAATLGFAVFVYRSADNGATWTDLDNEPGNDPRREIGGGVDKEYLHVDTYPDSPHLDNVYLTWHEGNVLQFARSTDMGHTWTEQAFSGASDMTGIGSDITTDKQGNIYYFWPATQSRKIWLRKSTDGGVDFDPAIEVAMTEGGFDFPIPSMEIRRVFIYVSAATDFSDGPYGNSIYASWTDNTGPDSGIPANNHARIQVAYSRDGGDTWSITTPHETADSDSVDRWHQWIAVGPDGTVYVVFYDTRNDPTRSSVDFYFSRSTDGAQTFSKPERLTTVASPNISGNFEFGDYNGLDVVMDQLIGVFTDNRIEDTRGDDSVDIYAVGRTVGIPGLLFADSFESGDTSAW
ncbi:MAG: sialidase family protein [Acidobacteriota bacterium]